MNVSNHLGQRQHLNVPWLRPVSPPSRLVARSETGHSHPDLLGRYHLGVFCLPKTACFVIPTKVGIHDGTSADFRLRVNNGRLDRVFKTNGVCPDYLLRLILLVIPGIEQLLDNALAHLAGRHVGLVSNVSGVNRNLVSTATLLHQEPACNLVALFAPEHGFQAAAPDGTAVSSTTHPATNLPVHSLYGTDKQPTAAMLAGIDTLIFDMQTVGVRFYTYVTTLLYVLETAVSHNIRVIVCDRPNPIGGHIVEGPILEPALTSFVGCGPIPIRHGLTIGELARFFNQVWQIGADLIVIPCQNWRRDVWFGETGLTWVAPSPNIPKWETAVIYPGTCLIEGTNLSEGRGTPLPFEVVGAPWLDGQALADGMNSLDLPGLKFRATQFTPTSSKWQGQLCEGVQLHVLDREQFRGVTAVMHLLTTILAQHPAELKWNAAHFDRLIGTKNVRTQLEAGHSASHIQQAWHAPQAQFREDCQRILLYDLPANNHESRSKFA